MLNRNEKLEIAKRLRHLTEMEMSRDELELLLDAELNKPEDELDEAFVQQLLELLEDGPTPEQQRKAWQKLDKQLTRQRWQPALKGIGRIAAVAVLLAAIMFATYGTAQALNWDFLLRLMKPFAETFMLYSGENPAVTPQPESSPIYGDFDLDFIQEDFAALADCPETMDGHPVRPVWMPERFTYVQGSMYTDLHITSFTHVYGCEGGSCIMDVTLHENVNEANAYHFEQIPADAVSTYAAGCQVAFYRNTRNEQLTASWVHQNVHYCLTGTLSEEEIISILEQMMK